MGDTAIYRNNRSTANNPNTLIMSDISLPNGGSGDSQMDAFVKSLLEENARNAAEKQALIEEFTRSIPAEWSPDDLKDKMRDLLAQAYARISMTIGNDDEPALAFNAAKYVMSIGIGQIKISDANDPNKELNELLKTLSKPGAGNDKKSAADTK